MIPKYTAAALLLAAALAGVLIAPSAVADDKMQWSFSEANDPENKGAMTARLSYGVPETDNIQVIGVCDARPGTGVKFSSLTFGADIGSDMKHGDPVDLRFSGGGFERSLKGSVQRPQGEEGIAGVHLDLEHDDPLWQALLDKDQLDYLVPGYRASSVDLGGGRDKIKSFHEACRTYAQAVPGDAKADAGGGGAEKEAFESAKELGTAAAWEAFLSNYASGFHADLARAYLKKLQDGDAKNAAAAPKSNAQALGPVLSSISKAPDSKTLAEIPYPAQRSCDERANLRSESYATPAKITFVHYSGPSRDVYWLDYAGQGQNMITIKPGQQTTVDTFVTHPWMITDASGTCIEIVLPRPVPSVVRFGEPAEPQKSAKEVKCRSGYLKIDGKCIRKQDAASYCGPGYRLQGNKCVQGYKPPPPQAQRPAWQIEAIKKGCKPGQGWNAQEGCHEND